MEEVGRWGCSFDRHILFPGPFLGSLAAMRAAFLCLPLPCLLQLCIRPEGEGTNWPSAETSETVSHGGAFPFEVGFRRAFLTVMGSSEYGPTV